MWWSIISCWAILVAIFLISCYIGDRIAARNGAISFVFDRFLLGVFTIVIIATGIAVIALNFWIIGVLF
jgi:hypothetical protein